MKTATATTPLTVLSVERSPAHQAIIIGHKRLNDAISQVDKSVDGSSPPPAETATSRLIEAARDFLHEASPLIDHLHAIIAALGDAIDYRHDDGGACVTATMPQASSAPTMPTTQQPPPFITPH